MRRAAVAAVMLLRLAGSTALVLGVLFWTGTALALVPLHVLSGVVVVLCLWVLALAAARAGAPGGLVGAAVLLGAVVPVLGLARGQLLPDPSPQWLAQILHLLVGLAAIGMGELLSARTRRLAASA